MAIVAFSDTRLKKRAVPQKAREQGKDYDKIHPDAKTANLGAARAHAATKTRSAEDINNKNRHLGVTIDNPADNTRKDTAQDAKTANTDIHHHAHFPRRGSAGKVQVATPCTRMTQFTQLGMGKLMRTHEARENTARNMAVEPQDRTTRTKRLEFASLLDA